MSRKRIALVTINIEDESEQRTMTGIFNQCRAYDYDVVVVSPMVHVSHYFKEYLKGELNIYELINFDLFDGVIITPIPMQEERSMLLTDYLLAKFQAECHVPVVSMNTPFGDYDVVYMDEKTPLKVITEHLINQHGCKDIMVLTGPSSFSISEIRVDGVREALEEKGLSLPQDHVIYGDFWYSSGTALGNRIAAKEFAMPDAVVCTSDHMAIGLIEALTNHGILVPQDIIVTGYGGSKEAAMNIPSVTSYDADESYSGASAVNQLRRLIEPQKVVYGVSQASDENICMGLTCGCPEDSVRIRTKIRNHMYTFDYSASGENQLGTSLSTLMDSYICEHYASSINIADCLNRIYGSSYLLKPYNQFYLCLNEEWVDSTKDIEEGYPEQMNMVMCSDEQLYTEGQHNHIYWGKGDANLFDTKKMLPIFDGEITWDEPQVFYFTPIHFGSKEIGYAVLRNPLKSQIRVGMVYRNYLRYISNALEMCRAKEYALQLSQHDQMTGLMNRRGMFCFLEEQQRNFSDNEKARWLAMVVDMNNLKLLNDTYGHEIGDAAIKLIARAMERTMSLGEVPVRGGGDEFFLAGIGEYDDDAAEKKIDLFQRCMQEENEKSELPMTIVAAAGAVLRSPKECDSFDKVLDEADSKMYVDKRNKKKLSDMGSEEIRGE